TLNSIQAKDRLAPVFELRMTIANDEVTMRASQASQQLLVLAAVVVLHVVLDVVAARELHDLLAGQLPGFLDNPRQRPVLSRGLEVDSLQHFCGEVEALLTLVGAGHSGDVRPEGAAAKR